MLHQYGTDCTKTLDVGWVVTSEAYIPPDGLVMMIIPHSCDGMDDVLRTRFPYNSLIFVWLLFFEKDKRLEREKAS